MPTYDYRCDACGHEFEEFQSITAKSLRKCPLCGKLKLVRLIGTGAGVIFKGSGFWQTDYRSKSYKEAAKADKEASGGGAKKEGDSGKSTETKKESTSSTSSESKASKSEGKGGSKSKKDSGK
jgi:putative FmdB family regulatory protein